MRLEKIYKRVLSGIWIITMFVSSLTGISTNATEGKTDGGTQILKHIDFDYLKDKEPVGDNSTIGAIKPKSEEFKKFGIRTNYTPGARDIAVGTAWNRKDVNNFVFEIQAAKKAYSGTDTVATFELDNAVNSGVVVYSTQYKSHPVETSKPDNNFLLWFGNSSGKEAVVFRAAKNFGRSKAVDGSWSYEDVLVDGNPVPVQQSKWYQVDIVVDFNTNKVSLYIDGQKVDERAKYTNLSDIKSINMQVVRDDEYYLCSRIADIKITQYDSTESMGELGTANTAMRDDNDGENSADTATGIAVRYDRSISNYTEITKDDIEVYESFSNTPLTVTSVDSTAGNMLITAENLNPNREYLIKYKKPLITAIDGKSHSEVTATANALRVMSAAAKRVRVIDSNDNEVFAYGKIPYDVKSIIIEGNKKSDASTLGEVALKKGTETVATASVDADSKIATISFTDGLVQGSSYTLTMFGEEFDFSIKVSEGFEIVYLGLKSKLEEAEKSGHRYAYCYVDGTKYVSKNCNVTHSGGSNKWYFTEYEGIGATRSLSTKIEIDKKYWNMEDNSTVAVTIFYYDLGDSLYRIYAYGDDWNDFALRGYLRGTCEKRWKTQTYYWDDFKNNIKENCDLNIASLFKNENVGIGGIFIEENRKEYGLDVTPENGYYGRIFSYGESDYMNFVCNNSNNSKVSSEITYTVKNNEGRILKTGRTERFDVEAGKEKEIQFETGVKDCGTYTITYGVKSITSEGTEEEYERTRKFSISQTLSEGEKRSDLLGMCYNFAVLNNNTKRDSSINQLLRFGIGSVRNDERWRMAELTEGVFTDDETTSRNRSQLIDNGIEYMGIAYSCPGFYNNNQGGGYYPDTEEALNAFKNYIKYLADKGIGYIEVFNEPNHSSYMTSGIGPSGVVKYCNAAREGVNASNHPETKLVAGSTAGFSRDFLDPFIKEGGMKYVDYLSYHPYQYPNFSASKLIRQAEQMQELMVETDGVAKPIILSEMGWSTAEDQATTGHGIPEEKRRQYVPVMYISAQASQKFETINYYCYNNIGTRLEEREDRFGLIEFPDGINSGVRW